MAAPNPSDGTVISTAVPCESSIAVKEAVGEDVPVADKAYEDCLVANPRVEYPELNFLLKRADSDVWYKVVLRALVYNHKIAATSAEIDMCSNEPVFRYHKRWFRSHDAYTFQEALDGLRIETIHLRASFEEEWQKEMLHSFDLREMDVVYRVYIPTEEDEDNFETKYVAKLGDFYPPTGKQCKRKREAIGVEEARSITLGKTD
jgi:hypothetical protein